MNSFFLVGPLLTFMSFSIQAQDHSVLAEGEWYKVSVQESGIYKLDRGFLADIGINVDAINPRNLKIFGNPGGMLPQANSIARPVDLVENAIQVIGESDGSFDNGDLVIFFAEGPDAHEYDVNGTLSYEQNKYSSENFYFITVGNTQGKRVTSLESNGTEFTKISSFNDFMHHELSLTNLLISGREWYGEKFDLTTDYTLEFATPGIIDESDIKITSKVMAQSFATSIFTIGLNNTPVGEHQVESVPDFRQKVYRYSIKGKENKQQFTINSSAITNPNQLALKYTYQKNSSGQSIGFLDWVTVETERKLQWYGETTIFRSLSSLGNALSTFEIAETDSELKIWNVTDPNNPFIQQYTQNGTKSLFGAETTTLQEYVLFKISTIDLPEYAGHVANQNLRGLTTPELLIVTHPDFKPEAIRLANFRQTHDGLTTAVVTTEEIYNEFSSGRQDVSAIRDFARNLYNKSDRLRYLLLFGRGSYDYLDVIPNNTNYVPIYESRNALHPLNTYGSDDYYGFLEDNEGEWLEESSGNHTLDIGVGRLPATTQGAAKEMVDKLISYSTDKKNYGTWRNTITFVADDGDHNLHQRQSDQLTQLVDTTYQSFNPNKLYLDAYPQISRPNGEISPAASEALNEAIDKGALIVNFTGHGGETGWMQEQVLDLVMIREWDNKYKLPLFVTATCEFSRHDDPRRVSGGELVVTNPKGGGIAIVSTCRPVSSSSNFELNKAFYNAVFALDGNEHLRLGDIFRITKNNESVNQVGNRNFALLGDPSLKLSYPKQTLTITAIKKDEILSDTIHALSNVTIAGDVLNSNNTLDSDFNGTLSVIAHDKESLFTTLGNENAPFNYYAKENVIFRGKASVKNGHYEFEFVVPKNISYQFEKGKISLYAVNNEQSSDANGSHFVTIGGSSASPNSDDQGPEISIYLGDTTNNNYQDIASNTNLIVYLQDESGINLSGYGVGNNIEAILDDSTTYILNAFYEAEKDTYKRGWVSAPLKNLIKGHHQLTIRAWDTHNNSSEKSIAFTVLDPDKLSISKLFNYPNPFYSNTNFTFQHNRAGEDLFVTLEILDRLGGLVQKFEFNIEDSSSNVNLVNWDGTNSYGKKLNAGLYLFKLTVRSFKDGVTNKRYERLVLIN